LCRHYGFKKASNPIIFAKTGTLIGTIEDFYQLAREKFDIDPNTIRLEIDHAVLRNIMALYCDRSTSNLLSTNIKKSTGIRLCWKRLKANIKSYLNNKNYSRPTVTMNL